MTASSSVRERGVRVEPDQLEDPLREAADDPGQRHRQDQRQTRPGRASPGRAPCPRRSWPSRAALDEHHPQRVPHPREPAETGVEHAEQTDRPGGAGVALERRERDLAVARRRSMPGNRLPISAIEPVAQVSGKTREIRPITEERQREDREERQEAEVGDRAGLRLAVDRRRSAATIRTTWSTDRAALADAARAPRAVPSARPSGHSVRGGEQRELPGRRQPSLVVVDVEVEARRRRSAHSKPASSSNAWSSSGVVEVVGDRDVRVVGEAQVDAERTAAYGAGELLAAGDALGERHEDDRRDRPEGAGAAQVDLERRRPRRPPPRGAARPSASVVGVDLGAAGPA